MSTGRNGKASHQVGPFTKTQELSKTLCFPWRDLVLMVEEIKVTKDDLMGFLAGAIAELAGMPEELFKIRTENRTIKFVKYDRLTPDVTEARRKDLIIEWS